MDALMWLAPLFGAGAGCFASEAVLEWMLSMKRKKAASALLAQTPADEFSSSGLSSVILRALLNEEQRIRKGQKGRKARNIGGSLGLQSTALYADLLNRSDLSRRVSLESCRRVRDRWAALASAGSFLVGFLVSAELGVILGALGLVLGFLAPKWALGQEAQARLRKLDKELPEMLEVVALGLRSGLSFERSFCLYVQHFDGVLAKACAAAQARWSTGLEGREESLKKLAASFGSPVLNRAMQSTIRSLRFGTSLAQTLEEAARDARIARKAARQEQVAKAPVKMMVPTGALILPAMLIMVLGPVLLELMAGF